jgi:AmmeMemoRadiSam system protein B
MKLLIKGFIILFFQLTLSGCKSGSSVNLSAIRVRQLVDTVGFARYSWQMDSIMARIGRNGWERSAGLPWKMVICPHDDYTYVGKLYPEILNNVKAKNLILIGVAHKAASLGIENLLVFDSYSGWKGPWGTINVSPVRNELLKTLDKQYSTVNDLLHSIEHSLEALIPFLQFFNKDISIVPILVPALSPARMNECGKALADAIRSVAASNGWEWGRDFAIVATTDAVHYGNEDWGSADYAYFGCDEEGNKKAVEHENEIISTSLIGQVAFDKIRSFNNYTLDSADFHKYKWTWCGRYCVPVALYASYYLSDSHPLSGELTGYSTSIYSKHIPVDDLGMGRTAIATACHWVGYAAIGFR